MKPRKWELLLAYIYSLESQGQVFTMAADANVVLALGISSSRTGLYSMLNLLQKFRYVCNDADHCWTLTTIGSGIADCIWTKYNLSCDTFICKNGSNTPNVTDGDSLKNALNEAEAKIANLKKQLLTTYDLLDKKTKECEKLKLGIERLSNECKNMASWAINIMNGQG